MRIARKYNFWLVALIICSQTLRGQTPAEVPLPVAPSEPGNEHQTLNGNSEYASYTVKEIIITGNRKTRPDIILRELPFKEGEEYSLKDLVRKFEEARMLLMNTALFHEVIVALKNSEGYLVDVSVEVRERMYIFPLPYFKPVDRNLNQWLMESKASLSRVNYGAKLAYNNVTGRNDKLRILLISGFTKQFSISYDRLYVDKAMKWGMSAGFAIGKNREVNYNTVNDKQVFLKDNDRYIRNFVSGTAEITYRRAIKTRHRFGISYTREEVEDTIVRLNPSYFKSGRNNIQFPELYYNMTYYDLDYNPYPTVGYAAQVMVNKKGLNNTINLWQLSVKGLGAWRVAPRYYLSVRGYGTVKLPFKQPYFTQRLLGYNDVFMQGYEYYVIDGVAGGYLKTALSRELLNSHINAPARKGKQAYRIPVRIYGKIHANAGYVHSPDPGDNFLSNKMLYSWGFGVDIVSFYDFTLKLEWTFNQLGQNGLFLHRRSIF